MTLTTATNQMSNTLLLMDSQEEPEEDCPICLSEMRTTDLVHPIRCPRQCGYNFCLTCIESLITSSKDDYGEASDGNMHVKVFLNCPNCRSDLGESIRDTLLLRKTHTLKVHSSTAVELTASEKRLKAVINDFEVQLAIKEAQEREDEFFGKKSAVDEETSSETEDADTFKPLKNSFNDSFTNKFSEFGVEADIDCGVHQSFVLKRTAPAPKDRSNIDPTLFQGLECAMSKEEQESVTDLLTSGDTDKLAIAAEIMNGIAIRVQKGLPPPKPQAEVPKRQVSRSSSIYQLIDESKLAMQKAALSKKSDASSSSSNNNNRKKQVRPHETKRMTNHQRFVQHREIEKELVRHAQFMKLHPLPVRMPKFVEFNLHDKTSRSFLPFFLSSDHSDYPLSFCNDVWDGSVIDAFCKLTVSGGKDPVVTKNIVENVGVVNILEGAGDDTGDWIGEEKGRVLVASVRSEAGRQGVLKGDVVTHFNGEAYEGTAEELDEAIRAQAERSENGTFTLVLNAERSVAEALKRRSFV